VAPNDIKVQLEGKEEAEVIGRSQRLTIPDAVKIQF
jgi:hypothetical protein